MGREKEARELFESLLAIRTPLGLLSEEYDCGARRLIGNFPQAFSHISLINCARTLSRRVNLADAIAEPATALSP